MAWAFSAYAGQHLLQQNGMPSELAVSFPPAVHHGLELYVFAALQCAGWFVEPNPKERDLLNLELFEIDAVARKPFAEPGQRLLAVEVKGGDWGATDVMLLLGRGQYVKAEGGVFAYRRDSRHGPLEQRVTPRLRELGIRPMRIVDVDKPSPENVLSALYQATAVPPSRLHAHCYRTWLYSHMVQDRLRPSWRPLLDALPGSASVRAARAWNVRVYENLPLVACPVERLLAQERSFNDFGRLLALRVANDIGATEQDRLPWPMLDEGQNRWVQAALLLQHVARLAILATIVEIVALLAPKEVDAIAAGSDKRLRPHWRRLVAALREHPGLARWPLLWQTYLCCWGGFLVVDRRDEELALLAEEVGMSVAEVEDGLQAFDALFPLQEGGRWHTRTASGLDVLTLVPAAVRGVGVRHRLGRLGVYRLDDSGHAMVNEALEQEYGVDAQAAVQLTKWHDVGVATVLDLEVVH